MASLIRNLIDNITELSIDNSTSDNDTFFAELPKWSPTEPFMKKFHDILIVILLICVMFAMGCSITLEQVSSSIMRLLII